MPWEAVCIVLAVALAPAVIYGAIVAWRGVAGVASARLTKRRKHAGECPRCRHPLHRRRQHAQRRYCPECGWNAPADAVFTRVLGSAVGGAADHRISETSTSSPSSSTRSSQA